MSDKVENESAENVENDAAQGKEKPKTEQNAPEHNKANREGDPDILYDIPVQVSAVLGKAHMPVHKLLKLTHGSIIELDRRIGEPLDIYVNERLVARGEVVQKGDNFGITMTEIVKNI